jgi:hypothetical protein
MSKEIRKTMLKYLIISCATILALCCGCIGYFLYANEVIRSNGDYSSQIIDLVYSIYHVSILGFAVIFALSLTILASLFIPKIETANYRKKSENPKYNSQTIASSPILKGYLGCLITFNRLHIFGASKDNRKTNNNNYNPYYNKNLTKHFYLSLLGLFYKSLQAIKKAVNMNRGEP